MYDADQRRWERTLDAARDIQRGKPPQRVLVSLLTEFETSVPADLPAYAVGELIAALRAALEAETRSHLERLCDDEGDMLPLPRRKQLDDEVSARSPVISPRLGGMRRGRS
jgi:hypothetical protein